MEDIKIRHGGPNPEDSSPEAVGPTNLEQNMYFIENSKNVLIFVGQISILYTTLGSSAIVASLWELYTNSGRDKALKSFGVAGWSSDWSSKVPFRVDPKQEILDLPMVDPRVEGTNYTHLLN